MDIILKIFLNHNAKKMLALVFSLLLSNNLKAEQSVYELNINQPSHHLAQVKLSLPLQDEPYIDLIMPAWRTGKYKILDLAKGVRSLNAYDQFGNSLSSYKIDKNTWRVSLEQASKINVQYQVYANQLEDRVRHIDDSHAYIDASGFFLYAEKLRQHSILVKLSVPEGWQSWSGMDKGKLPHSFLADNYDVLVDSPIETGKDLFFQSFSSDNRDYEIVFWGKGNYDAAMIKQDLAKLAAEAKNLWPDYPFQRYLYIIHAVSGRGGATEHLNSTVIQKNRFSFQPRKEYIKFINTASHEFVHTWNVKAYRPAGILPYDYTQENYSRLFWIVEGATSYYDGLLLVRAGVISVKEFLQQWADSIEEYKNKPGRLVNPLAEASFNQWISDEGDRGINSNVSIYLKGSLVSWLIDFEIRRLTENKKSYDDVHRLLYQRFPISGKGYTEQDVKLLLNEVSGHDFAMFWQKYIDGLEEIDFNILLELAGLEIIYDAGKKKSKESQQQAWAGFVSEQNQEGFIEITEVRMDSPAWKAGLTPGDLVLAADGLKMNKELLQKKLRQHKPGDIVQLHYFRRDELLKTEIELGRKQKGKLKLQSIDNPSAEQQAFFKAWTGQDLKF